MTIQLSKSQRVGDGFQTFEVSLRWEPNPDIAAPLFDLDLSAFLLAPNGQIPTEEHFVFYNNPESPDGAVKLVADDRVGGLSDSDGERLLVDLSKLELSIPQILLCVSIYEAAERKQTFGLIPNAQIAITDAQSGKELCRYDLEADFSPDTAVEFGRLIPAGGTWRFEPLGVRAVGGLQALVNKCAKKFA